MHLLFLPNVPSVYIWCQLVFQKSFNTLYLKSSNFVDHAQSLGLVLIRFCKLMLLVSQSASDLRASLCIWKRFLVSSCHKNVHQEMLTGKRMMEIKSWWFSSFPCWWRGINECFCLLMHHQSALCVLEGLGWCCVEFSVLVTRASPVPSWMSQKMCFLSIYCQSKTERSNEAFRVSKIGIACMVGRIFNSFSTLSVWSG